MNVPALVNDDLKYKRISGHTVHLINSQRYGTTEIKQKNDQDLYNEDVRLIENNGKMYYLPPEQGGKGE